MGNSHSFELEQQALRQQALTELLEKQQQELNDFFLEQGGLEATQFEEQLQQSHKQLASNLQQILLQQQPRELTGIIGRPSNGSTTNPLTATTTRKGRQISTKNHFTPADNIGAATTPNVTPSPPLTRIPVTDSQDEEDTDESVEETEPTSDSSQVVVELDQKPPAVDYGVATRSAGTVASPPVVVNPPDIIQSSTTSTENQNEAVMDEDEELTEPINENNQLVLEPNQTVADGSDCGDFADYGTNGTNPPDTTPSSLAATITGDLDCHDATGTNSVLRTNPLPEAKNYTEEAEGSNEKQEQTPDDSTCPTYAFNRIIHHRFVTSKSGSRQQVLVEWKDYPPSYVPTDVFTDNNANILAAEAVATYATQKKLFSKRRWMLYKKFLFMRCAFDKIVSHREAEDWSCGSRYEVQVKWKDFPPSFVPLRIFTDDKNNIQATKTLAIYAQENNLLYTPGWIEYQPFRPKYYALNHQKQMPGVVMCAFEQIIDHKQAPTASVLVKWRDHPPSYIAMDVFTDRNRNFCTTEFVTEYAQRNNLVSTPAGEMFDKSVAATWREREALRAAFVSASLPIDASSATSRPIESSKAMVPGKNPKRKAGTEQQVPIKKRKPGKVDLQEEEKDLEQQQELEERERERREEINARREAVKPTPVEGLREPGPYDFDRTILKRLKEKLTEKNICSERTSEKVWLEITDEKNEPDWFPKKLSIHDKKPRYSKVRRKFVDRCNMLSKSLEEFKLRKCGFSQYQCHELILVQIDLNASDLPYPDYTYAMAFKQIGKVLLTEKDIDKRTFGYIFQKLDEYISLERAARGDGENIQMVEDNNQNDIPSSGLVQATQDAPSVVATVQSSSTKAAKIEKPDAMGDTSRGDTILNKNQEEKDGRNRSSSRCCAELKRLSYEEKGQLTRWDESLQPEPKLRFKVCCVVSDNVKQNRVGMKIASKIRKRFPRDVQVTTLALGEYEGSDYTELSADLSQYNAIAILPGVDPDKKIDLHAEYLRYYKELCSAVFKRGKCIPAQSSIMNLFDKINLMTLLAEADVPVLPWRIIHENAYTMNPVECLKKLREFAGESPKLVLKAPFTTTLRGVRFMKKGLWDEDCEPKKVQSFFQEIFRPGFSAVIVQHFTSYFENNEEHRLYFASGQFVTASATFRSSDRPLGKDDVKEEIEIAETVLDKLPWLKMFPNLRIDFGRNEAGDLIVSEVEPTADIFSENDNHLDAIANAYVRHTTFVLNGGFAESHTEKASHKQQRKHSLLDLRGQLGKLQTHLKRDFTTSEDDGRCLAGAKADIMFQEGRVLRKRKR